MLALGRGRGKEGGREGGEGGRGRERGRKGIAIRKEGGHDNEVKPYGWYIPLPCTLCLHLLKTLCDKMTIDGCTFC